MNVSRMGFSVVDYMCVPYQDVPYWTGFRVTTVGELLDDSGFTPMATTNLPDRSVLVSAYTFSEYCLEPVNESRHNENNDETEVKTHRIYKKCSLSDGFLKVICLTLQKLL